ncbi:hypothetical protein NDU88_000213 [Pleurodeles waltl]|uniref:Uncharacterized protein n=1 Tax=Pleurodeles waltl TaxID=8319 RepID=A0AAV7S9G4_PLEWA|nr:hypothetical protein NDU88_000213 [Pleurodeles waltl]
MGAWLRRQRCRTRSPRAPAGPSLIQTHGALPRSRLHSCLVPCCEAKAAERAGGGRSAQARAKLTEHGGAAVPGAPEHKPGARVTAARGALRAASRRWLRRELTLAGGPPGAGGGTKPKDSGEEWTPERSPEGLGRARRYLPSPCISGVQGEQGPGRGPVGGDDPGPYLAVNEASAQEWSEAEDSH